jgi:hypothetical protein
MTKIKKLYTALLILLGVATLCMIFLTEKSASKNGEKTAGENSVQSGSLEKTTAAWQLYENKEEKFRFKYPQNWTVKADKDEFGNTVVKLSSSETMVSAQKETEAAGGEAVEPAADVVIHYAPTVAESSINKANGYGAITLRELVGKDPDMTRIAEAGLDGVQTMEVIVNGEGDSYGKYIEKDGRLYEISFTYRADKGSMTETEKNILGLFEVE